MSLPSTDRCSVQAKKRDDQLIGTAPVARRWLLVEHPGAWEKEVLDTEPLAGRIGEAIADALAAHDARLLLIRRHGRQADTGSRIWLAVDTATRLSVQGTWSASDDLRRAAGSLGSQLAHEGEVADELLLVCTHATRDTCCAIKGRPVSAALERRWPDQVWECSHLGGHRFASTVLSLPDGTCYGTLDLASCVRVIERHRAGEVDTARLRGMTRWRPPIQAALARVLADHGPAAVEHARPGTVEEVSPTVVRVEVRGDEPLPAVTWLEVETRQLPPAPLSCGGSPRPRVAYDVTPVAGS